MEKRFSIYLFYAFLVVGITSFPGVFVNFWFCYISAPLCVLLSLIFISFLCLKVLANSLTKSNALETEEDHLKLLGKITLKEKIIISDSLTEPYQLIFESFSAEYYIYIYQHAIADISVLIITTLSLRKNCLKDFFERVCELDHELIVDSGSIFVFSLDNIESKGVNDIDLHNGMNHKHYFLHNVCDEKTGVVVYPKYGDGTYSVAIPSQNLDHSVVVELIPDSIEKIRCLCPEPFDRHKNH